MDVLADKDVVVIAEEVEETLGDGAVHRRGEVVYQDIRQVADVDGVDSPSEGAVGEAADLPEEGEADDPHPLPWLLYLPHPLVALVSSVGHKGPSLCADDSTMHEIF